MTNTLHEDQYTFSITSRAIHFRMRIFSEEFVEKIKTHICNQKLIKSCRL